MLSSATKMDIFPTFLQSEKDFDEVGSNYQYHVCFSAKMLN